MLGGEKGSVAFHGDHRPAKVATHRRSRNLADIPDYEGVLTNGYYLDKATGFILEAGKAYTLSADVSSEIEPFNISAGYTDGPFSYFKKDIKTIVNLSNGRCSITFTPTAEEIEKYGKYLAVRIPRFGTKLEEECAVTVKNIMIAEDEDHSYEPYGTIEQVISEPVESTQEGTALTFDRTYNDRAEVSVFGESTQETLTGKNLFNPSETWNYSVYADNGDGTFSIVTANGDGRGWSDILIDGVAPYLKAGTYTASIELLSCIDGSSAFIECKYGSADNVNRSFSLTLEVGVRKSKTFTISEDCYVGIKVYDGNYKNNANWAVVSEPQIELGSTATSYEPYCGGIPAPNPSYPMPIESMASACVETSNADGSKTSTTDLTALLDGRELRSLPDGTRDELVVHRDGTVVLVQCVESVDMGSLRWIACGVETIYSAYVPIKAPEDYQARRSGFQSSAFLPDPTNIAINEKMTDKSMLRLVNTIVVRNVSVSSAEDFTNSVTGETLNYALATPTETVLGTIPMPETFYDTTHVWEANGADISARVKVFG